MFYIYILYSVTSDSYYVGSSINPWTRLVQHNAQSKITFTTKHRPWILVAAFSCSSSRSEALRLERLIKKQKSRKLIEKLVDPEFIPDKELAQLVRVPHVRD